MEGLHIDSMIVHARSGGASELYMIGRSEKDYRMEIRYRESQSFARDGNRLKESDNDNEMS